MKRIASLLLICFLPAVLSYSQLPDKNKKEAKKAYNEAVTYISEGNYEPAVTYLNACLELDSTFTPALSARAKAKVEMGNIVGAENDFKLLRQKDPSNGEP
ncbi:MAG TPA: hypothetical protein VE870_09190, partial [Bacteroidales bacterium]|nr:hypothetical protein [Bacteroidales bacterium]